VQRSGGSTCPTVPARLSRKSEESRRSRFGSVTWRCSASLVRRSWLTSIWLPGMSGRRRTDNGEPCVKGVVTAFGSLYPSPACPMPLSPMVNPLSNHAFAAASSSAAPSDKVALTGAPISLTLGCRTT
jgi:hypothetical protein